mgnify:CR=1 FL=1
MDIKYMEDAEMYTAVYLEFYCRRNGFENYKFM